MNLKEKVEKEHIEVQLAQLFEKYPKEKKIFEKEFENMSSGAVKNAIEFILKHGPEAYTEIKWIDANNFERAWLFTRGYEKDEIKLAVELVKDSYGMTIPETLEEIRKLSVKKVKEAWLELRKKKAKDKTLRFGIHDVITHACA